MAYIGNKRIIARVISGDYKEAYNNGYNNGYEVGKSEGGGASDEDLALVKAELNNIIAIQNNMLGEVNGNG